MFTFAAGSILPAPILSAAMGLFKRRGQSDQVETDALLARVEQRRLARQAAENAGTVRGRHYVDWKPVLDDLRSQGRDEEAIPLLMEIIEAAERAAKIEGVDPPPGWTKRAAIIYRRRKDYAAEVEVLQRYIAACPPGRGSSEIVERLQIALRLASQGSAPSS